MTMREGAYHCIHLGFLASVSIVWGAAVSFFAVCALPVGLRVAPLSALTAVAASPAGASSRVLCGFAGNGRRFRHGSGLLCGFRRELFAVGSVDLGKRRRVMAFRADSACETAQKFADGVFVRRFPERE